VPAILPKRFSYQIPCAPGNPLPYLGGTIERKNFQQFLRDATTHKRTQPKLTKDHARKDVKIIFFSILPKNLTSLEILSEDFSVSTTFRLSPSPPLPHSVGNPLVGRKVIQLLNPVKVGCRWGTSLRYPLPAAAKISIKWWTKKAAGVFTPAGGMSLNRLSIKKLSIVVYNNVVLFLLCQVRQKRYFTYLNYGLPPLPECLGSC